MTTTKTDPLALWKQVETSDPATLKHVNKRGGFTAIAAQAQLYKATSLWGPYGGSWGMRDLEWEYLRDASGDIVELALNATFFYPLVTVQAFPISADIAYKPGNDSRKKLLTDATTKALSKLGFNADVFMGKFDDNKYVVNGNGTPQQSGTSPTPSNTPTCPDCGKPMVQRSGKKGEFYGCSTFPACTGTRQLSEAQVEPASRPDDDAPWNQEAPPDADPPQDVDSVKKAVSAAFVERHTKHNGKAPTNEQRKTALENFREAVAIAHPDIKSIPAKLYEKMYELIEAGRMGLDEGELLPDSDIPY